jgi:formate hydrogenlyase subunit 3/multisubunit Na+/H+ antiporter MnhD subunit
MIWITAVFFPLLIAAVCVLPGPGLRIGCRLMSLAALPALYLAVTGDACTVTDLENFLLKSSLGFGPSGNTFLLITSLIWFTSGLFWALGPRKTARSRSFCVMFLLTMCGNIGLVTARDAVSFYTFFALMTFCSFSLIVHSGTDLARRAGRIYLIMAVLGEGLLIAGILMAVFSSPSHYFIDIASALAWLPETHPVFLTLFAGFGIKAGMVFLHFWLPLAHPVAPAPASAVLSASMIKAGLVGWINFFPLGVASFDTWGIAFAALGIGGAFFGAIAGLLQKDPKIILAYSSISQMGLMIFCLGLGIMDQMLWLMAAPVIYLLVFNHALSKSALFLGTAVAGSDISGPRKKILVIMLAIPALALAGAPFSGGAQAKYLLKEAVNAGPFNQPFLSLIFMSSILTALLMAHFMRQIITTKKKSQANFSQTMLWVILIIAILGLPWVFHELYRESRIMWTDSSFLLSAAWPVLTGIVLYLLFGRKIEKLTNIIMRSLPDMALIIDKTWYHLNSRITQHGLMETGWGQMNFARFTERIVQSQSVRKISRDLELRMSNWSIFGMLFMSLIIIFALLVLWGT